MNEPDFKCAKRARFMHPGRHDAVDSLIQMRAEFSEDLHLLQEELTTRQKEIEALDFLIGSIRGSVEAALDGEDTNWASEPVSGTATVRDITHCSTQREAARVIAEVNDGDIHLKSAARVIAAAGLSKGLVSTIVSSLHNFMSNSADWGYSGPSKFRLVSGQEALSKNSDSPSLVIERVGETHGAVGVPSLVSERNETAA